MIYVDPILPKLSVPTENELKITPIRFGDYYMTLTPHQWQFVMTPEKFVCWIGGVRSGKTIGGIGRALKLSLFIPNNRGIVGRQFASDLEETTQRDFIEIADATGLVKHRNDKKIEFYCWDTELERPRADKATSEVLFQHLDNPKHIKGHGIGWGWIDEASEVRPDAYFRIVDRLSRPAAEGHYSAFLTSNPEGRNWLWNHFFNPETVEKRRHADRLKHRAVHNKTTENQFLTSEYVENLLATAPDEWVRRYVDGEFDVFEGQIYKEFAYEIHTVNSKKCKGFKQGRPPDDWPRYMGIDTGGTDPWAFEIGAIDPYGNIIWYDEVYRPETYVAALVPDVKKKMGGLTFKRIPMDYENKSAMEELRHHGIRVSNAVKVNKREGAINKVARYLHPNPLRKFPEWHPKAGQPGSPGMFFTEGVPKLVEEVPQQRWREISGIAVNEADPHVADHACSAMYYVIRERPEPQQLLKMALGQFPEQTEDIRSKYYWGRVAETKELQGRLRKWRGLVPEPRVKVWVN